MLSNHMQCPEDTYQKLVKDTLARVDDKFLAEDIDLLCQYIVLRFLKTSSLVVDGADTEVVSAALRKYLDERFSFIMTFITVVNSDPSAVKAEA